MFWNSWQGWSRIINNSLLLVSSLPYLNRLDKLALSFYASDSGFCTYFYLSFNWDKEEWTSRHLRWLKLWFWSLFGFSCSVRIPLSFIIVTDAGLHYSIYYGEGITYSILIMETMRFVCIFLVCYYVTKKTSLLLPTRKKWLSNLKMFFIINILWLFMTLTMAILAY